DGEELRPQEQPYAGGREEAQHEPERGMHGVARRDDPQRRENQYRGKNVEGESEKAHYGLESARARRRSLAGGCYVSFRSFFIGTLGRHGDPPRSALRSDRPPPAASLSCNRDRRASRRDIRGGASRRSSRPDSSPRKTRRRCTW